MLLEQRESSITTSSYFYHKSLHALFKPHRVAKLVILGCSPPLVIPLKKNLPWLFICLLNKVQAPSHSILVLLWSGTILRIAPHCHDFSTSPYLTAQLPSPKLTLSFSISKLCWKHYLENPFLTLSACQVPKTLPENFCKQNCRKSLPFLCLYSPFPLTICYMTATWAHIFTA